MNYKSLLFWIGAAQLLLSILNLIAGQPAGTSVIVTVTGVMTLILNWIPKPQPPSLTAAASARRSWWDRFYSCIWFNTEFWVRDKLLRRPFTYWMRDFWVQHKVWGWLIFTVVSAGCFALCVWSLWFLPLLLFHGMLFAHLQWGSPYKPGEQEDPPVTY